VRTHILNERQGIVVWVYLRHIEDTQKNWLDSLCVEADEVVLFYETAQILEPHYS